MREQFRPRVREISHVLAQLLAGQWATGLNETLGWRSEWLLLQECNRQANCLMQQPRWTKMGNPRDAAPEIVPGKCYGGYLYAGSKEVSVPEGETTFSYSGRRQAKFSADELEVFSTLPLRFMQRRSLETAPKS